MDRLYDTPSPQMYIGPIGRRLEDCETLLISSLSNIPVKENLLITNPNDLSKDRKYLYDSFNAVKSG